MAGAFEDYKIGWGKMEYTIPARRVLEVIASVESVITFGELYDFAQRAQVPFAKLARAYGIILRAAGVRGENGGPITDYEVHQVIGSELSGEDLFELASGLVNLITPPQPKNADGGEPAPGNSPRASTGAKASSKPSTKRSSVRAG